MQSYGTQPQDMQYMDQTMNNHHNLRSQSTNSLFHTQKMVTQEQQKYPTTETYQNSVCDNKHQITYQVMNIFVESSVPQTEVVCNIGAQQ
eukprot:11745188-Ditylum_brightwellii.AAC.1